MAGKSYKSEKKSGTVGGFIEEAYGEWQARRRPMTPQEAKAFLNGFTAGAIYFAGDLKHFREHRAARPDVYDQIRRELAEAQSRIPDHVWLTSNEQETGND